MYLKPLRRHFEEMEEVDYLELEKLFPPVLHVLCLVWAHCDYYRQPARVIVLLKEITNLMIEIVRKRQCYMFFLTEIVISRQLCRFKVHVIHSFIVHVLVYEIIISLPSSRTQGKCT